MAREYEMMFILQPDLAEEETEKIIGQATEWVTSSGGEVVEVEKIGIRKLAYRIDGHRDGFYVLIRLQAEGDTVKQIDLNSCWSVAPIVGSKSCSVVVMSFSLLISTLSSTGRSDSMG